MMYFLDKSDIITLQSLDKTHRDAWAVAQGLYDALNYEETRVAADLFNFFIDNFSKMVLSHEVLQNVIFLIREISTQYLANDHTHYIDKKREFVFKNKFCLIDFMSEFDKKYHALWDKVSDTVYYPTLSLDVVNLCMKDYFNKFILECDPKEYDSLIRDQKLKQLLTNE